MKWGYSFERIRPSDPFAYSNFETVTNRVTVDFAEETMRWRTRFGEAVAHRSRFPSVSHQLPSLGVSESEADSLMRRWHAETQVVKRWKLPIFFAIFQRITEGIGDRVFRWWVCGELVFESFLKLFDGEMGCQSNQRRERSRPDSLVQPATDFSP